MIYSLLSDATENLWSEIPLPQKALHSTYPLYGCMPSPEDEIRDEPADRAGFGPGSAWKFVRPCSVRIASTNRGDKSVDLTEDEEQPGVMRLALMENAQVFPNVAFKTRGGKIAPIRPLGYQELFHPHQDVRSSPILACTLPQMGSACLSESLQENPHRIRRLDPTLKGANHGHPSRSHSTVRVFRDFGIG